MKLSIPFSTAFTSLKSERGPHPRTDGRHPHRRPYPCTEGLLHSMSVSSMHRGPPIKLSRQDLLSCSTKRASPQARHRTSSQLVTEGLLKVRHRGPPPGHGTEASSRGQERAGADPGGGGAHMGQDPHPWGLGHHRRARGTTGLAGALQNFPGTPHTC